MDTKDKTNSREAAASRPAGYGNPPQATRFQPGKSGNPADRPKGSGLFKEALRKAAMEETTNDEYEGKTHKGTMLQLLLHDRFRRALHLGDNKASAEVLKLARLLDDDAE